MLLHFSILLTSPIPGWFPKAALVAFGVLAVWFLLFAGGFVVFLIAGGRKVMTGKELPAILARLRDAGHPVRRHQHLHYSAKASEELYPLTETEFEEPGFDEDF